MNHNNPDFMGNPVTNHSQVQRSTGQADPAQMASQQQKRHNSLSNPMTNNSNKRFSNPLQLPALKNSSNNKDYGFMGSGNITSGISSPAAPQVASPRYYNNPSLKGNFRRSMLQQQLQQPNVPQNHNHFPSSKANTLAKTPTPSAYDVPSSPNINAMSSISAQNVSDLPDSNPTVDQSVATKPQTDTNEDVASAKTTQLSSLSASDHASHKQLSQVPNQPQQREMSEEEQQLATKLKETYKNIVNYEEMIQKSCLDLSVKINQLTGNPNTNSPFANNSPLVGLSSSFTSSHTSNIASNVKTSELLNDLWTVHHHNISLLDNYTDFLITALKPSSNDNQDQFKTGKNIVDLYKIPRRMWVYGVVAFLEVLKNVVGIFQDHEICLCFISHCFSIISNLTDPVLDMEGWWLEKLGDLSRMAIALYSSKFIDWKFSAEYWYSIAMRTLHGHGKIYYHMCTVQQDNLDALVNIGKSVSCRDPFVPTQQYLRLVVENICTQRNILSLLELPIIDFIKIHKVLLSINANQLIHDGNPNGIDNIHETQLQYGIDLVSRYSITFGSDSNGYNFFTRELYSVNGMNNPNDSHNNPYYLQQQQQQSGINNIEKLNFWMSKGPLFAIANINHIIGLGDSRNPFAKLFLLPEALKERKDKKDRKRKSKASISEDLNLSNPNSLNEQSVTASELSVENWFYCLNFLNKSVIELSIRILKHYLIGPIQASCGHVIIWLYFLIAIGEAVNKNPNANNMFKWFLRKLFPWESLINYLNNIQKIIVDNFELRNRCRELILGQSNYVQYFNEHEKLAEVWKCWGTLWFDFVGIKTDYSDPEGSGVTDYNIFDLPVSGISASLRTGNSLELMKAKETPDDNFERIIRIFLLARYIAINYDFGLVRTTDGFKFHKDAIATTDQLLANKAKVTGEEFLYGDNRFILHKFFETISWNNQFEGGAYGEFETAEADERDFKLSVPLGADDNDLGSKEEAYGEDLGDELIDDLEDQFVNDQGTNDMFGNNNQRVANNNNIYGQQQQQQQQPIITNNYIEDELYNNNDIMINPEDLSIMTPQTGDMLVVGNLGDRMDTSLTYMTLDTNIWLKHCGRIFKCIRSNLLKVLIPLIVFQELRSLRKSSETTIADAATRSVIIIRELYLAKEILPIRFNGTAASDINETTEFENNSNWRAGVDETILNALNAQNQIGRQTLLGKDFNINNTILDTRLASTFRYNVLITDDRNMRLRAKTIGVVSFQSKWLFNQIETVFPTKCID